MTVQGPIEFACDGSLPVLVFANIITTADATNMEQVNANAMTIKAIYRKTGSTGRWRTVTFRGRASYSCASGEIVESDPLSFRHKQGDKIDVRLYVSGTNMPAHMKSNLSAGYIINDGADKIDGSTITNSGAYGGNGGDMPWFLCVHSIPDDPNQRGVVAIGDSILDGNSAITAYNAFKPDRGWQTQILTGLKTPWVCISRNAFLLSSLIDATNNTVKTTQTALSYVMKYATDVWCSLGTNDFNNIIDQLTFQNAIRSYARILTECFTNDGLRVWWSTVTPYSARTTGDVEVQPLSYPSSNMDAASFGQLNSFNDWLRAGNLVPTNRVIEAADVIQVVRNNIAARIEFLNTGGVTPDSIPVHPNPAGEAALVSACTAQVQAALLS
jgi:hypothetical protein